MRTDNFNEIEKILEAIKEEGNRYNLKSDTISKVSCILKERQYRTLFYYKKILGTLMVFLVVFNIFQGIMLIESREKINLLSKVQIQSSLAPSLPTVINIPSVSESSSATTPQKNSISKTTIDKSSVSLEEKKEETDKELIYASTKGIKEMLEMYNIFNTILSPVILQGSNGTNIKEDRYEAI